MKKKSALVVINNQIEKVNPRLLEDQSDVSKELELVDAGAKDLLLVLQELQGVKSLPVYKARIEISKALAVTATIRKEIKRR